MPKIDDYILDIGDYKREAMGPKSGFLVLDDDKVLDLSNYLKDLLDVEVSAIKTITAEHAHIHEGKMFTKSGIATLNTAGEVNILIKGPVVADNCEAHFEYMVGGGVSTKVQFFKGTTVSNEGTELTPINRKTDSENVPCTKIFLAPTITDVGTEINIEQFGNKTLAGGEARADNEFELYDDYFLLKITAQANADDITWKLNWYEIAE